MAEKPFIEKIYNLKQNPFTNWVDPTAEMAGRLQEKSQWEDIINRRKGANTNSMCFVHGEYGFGKTLTLFKIIDEYKTDPEILPIFMKMLSEDKTTKFGVDFIQRIFRQVPIKVFEAFSISNIKLLETFFPEPASVFTRIALKGKGDIEFLYGHRSFSATEMNKLGVRQRIDSTEIAKKYLLCFLLLLGSINIKTLLLAVDETEYVFSQMTGTNIALVFNSLRDLFDLQTSQVMPNVQNYPYKSANMIFFFGISSGGWKQINDLGRREQSKPGPVQAYLRRLELPIVLQPLDSSETKDLIEKRLYRDRASGQPVEEPLIPYDATFVKYIFDKSLGNPSEIVKFCDFALEDGLKEKVKILDEKFARKVFLDRGLVLE
jgi:type II secretory pathway predicted ATPase ExeA